MVAAQDVAAINFIAASKPLKEALKSANLLKSLPLNTLIIGQPGTGRHTLATLMMSDAPLVHGDDPMLDQLIESNEQLIIDRFERIENIPKLIQLLKKHNRRIVAIADDSSSHVQAMLPFGVRIVLPPLAARPEDIPLLVRRFLDETALLFGEEPDEGFEIDMKRLDLSQNAFSLRKSVFLQYFANKVEEGELMTLVEAYLSRHMDDQGDLYRRHLSLYEVPLIRAGTKRFKSQLKMSQAFGLNRNTLRKKINEWKDYL